MAAEDGAYNVIHNFMKLDNNDVLTIVTDQEALPIAHIFSKVARPVVKEIILFVMEDFGPRDNPDNPLKFPDEIREAMKRSTCSMYAADIKPGEYGSFRKPMGLFVQERKMKHAHMPLVKMELLEHGMTVNVDELRKLTDWVTEQVRGCKEVKVTCPLGSNITIELDPKVPWIPENGEIKAGMIENYPNGEVFTAPKSATGTVFFSTLGDHFPKYGPRINDPLVVTYKHGKIVEAKCNNEDLIADFNEYIKRDEFANFIGELGLGTNLACTEPINNLLQDEKMIGVHIASGHAYPEYTGVQRHSSTHLDGVIVKPTVVVDGKMIMKDGQYLNE